jgi:hypothetical protein
MESLKENKINKKETTFLGRKRGYPELIETEIFRNLFFEEDSEGEYIKTYNIFKNLFSFDWEDERIIKPKIHPRKNLINLTVKFLLKYV